MSDYPIAQIMQMYAADAVKYAQDKFGLVLDHSEQSLVKVDLVLSAMTVRGLLTEESLTDEQKENLWVLCKVFGGYVGEVIIKHIGGEWQAEDGAGTETAVKLKVAGRLTASPPEKVWKRLTQSESDMITGYYRAMQHHLGLTPTPLVPQHPKTPWWKFW